MEPNQPDRVTNNQPLFNAPYTDPTQTGPVVLPPSDQQPAGRSGNKLILLIIAAAGVELLIIIGLVAVLSNPKAAPVESKTDTISTQSRGPEAATATEVQLTSDSISQDISGLNDDADFPANKLSDQTLGL